MTVRTVLQIMALVLGIATSAFATSSAKAPSEAAVSGAAEAIAKGEAKAGAGITNSGNPEKDGTGSPVIESDCLKEGEPCNLITDRCCPGYTCQGGLAATCTRKE